MLTGEQIKSIASIIKVDESVLKKAINSDKEESIEIKELFVFDKTEIQSRDENIKRQGYSEGKTAGIELLVKEYKEKYGVQIEGKDPHKFIEAFKEKIISDSGFNPNEKVTELQNSLSVLQSNYDNLEKEKNEIVANQNRINIESSILNGVNKDFIIGKNEVFSLMKSNGYSFEEEDGAIVAKKDGQIIRDERTQRPVDPSIAIESYAVERKLVKDDSEQRRGRGASSNSQDSCATTLSELKDQFEKEGKNTNSEEFMSKCRELSNSNPNFMNEQ